MGHLYLMRHGETTHNADGVIQGPRVDSELSDAGFQQAESLADAFEETPLDGIYASPLLRARATANALIRRRLGSIPSSVVPELYEMDFGDLCGRLISDVEGDVHRVFDAWQMGYVDEPFPGGESPVLAQLRIRAFAKRARAEAASRDIAIVAHGRINRILLATLVGVSLRELARFPQDNCCINHLEVDAEGKVDVRRINDTGHLDPSL